MSGLQIMAGLSLLGGGAIYVLGRRKGAEPRMTLISLGLLGLGLIIALVAACRTPVDREGEMLERISRSQWDYPLAELDRKIGGGSVAVILPPAGELGCSIESLQTHAPSSLVLKGVRAGSAGLSAELLQSLKSQGFAAIILTIPLPRDEEERAALLESLAAQPPGLPLLLTSQEAEDAADLASCHSLWRSVQPRLESPAAAPQPSAGLKECFDAAYLLIEASACQSRRSAHTVSHPESGEDK
ncbi:MAG: hypothetical protein RL095_3166 [Verrucomicrobiota bacterium]|jgi:hypothetical protein